MCGVLTTAEAYIARLIAKGYKVAICEQTEDPAQAKGLVDREVIRVVTPAPSSRRTCWRRGRTTSWLPSAATAGAGLCLGTSPPGGGGPHLLPGGGVGQPGGERAGPVCSPGGPPLGRRPGPGGLWENKLGCRIEQVAGGLRPDRAWERVRRQFTQGWTRCPRGGALIQAAGPC